MINGEFDALRTNPMTAMTAMTRDDGDLVNPLPLLRELNETSRLYLEVKQQLPEIKRQFLEARRRYRLFQEIVQLRRVLWIRRVERLEELARVRRLLRQQQEGGQIRQNDPEADAARSRLAQEKALKEDFLQLEKLRELIRLGENLLYRQQRALKRRRKAAAAQVLPDQEMRDNILRLQKLKELLRIRQESLRRRELALHRQNDAVAPQRHPEPDPAANAPLRCQDLRHETQISNTTLDSVNTHNTGAGFRGAGWGRATQQPGISKHARGNNICRNYAFRANSCRNQVCRSNAPGLLVPPDVIVRGPP
jgi:hypothetical protein